tara:strand:- start:4568 stop:5017 length:450 start_codon:yes stop_codon:yes gene_type:complete
MRVLGIDPGVGGGAVVIANETPVSVMTYTTEQDFIAFVESVAGAVDAAFIEKVNAFPGQGVASTWKFAQNYGFERGVVRTLKIPLHEVLPQKWQKGLGIPQVKEKTKRKAALKDTAGRLFPKMSWTLKTCDAALIAYYGVKTLSSPESR